MLIIIIKCQFMNGLTKNECRAERKDLLLHIQTASLATNCRIYPKYSDIFFLPSQRTRDVETTSIQRWFNVLTLNQRSFNVVCDCRDTQNVESTLNRCCFNVVCLDVASTLFQSCVPAGILNTSNQRSIDVVSTLWLLDVESMLYQCVHWDTQDVKSTLFQRCVSAGIPVLKSENPFYCWHRWLSRMRVRWVIRRSRVRSPPGLATFFWRDWSWNVCYGYSLPFADSKMPVVSFWWKNVNRLEDLDCPGKCG